MKLRLQVVSGAKSRTASPYALKSHRSETSAGRSEVRRERVTTSLRPSDARFLGSEINGGGEWQRFKGRRNLRKLFSRRIGHYVVSSNVVRVALVATLLTAYIMI
jgi:hypothetical protein